MQSCCWMTHSNILPGTRALAPKPHVRLSQEAHVIWGTGQAKVCAEKDHSCSPWEQHLPEHIKTLWE